MECLTYQTEIMSEKKLQRDVSVSIRSSIRDLDTGDVNQITSVCEGTITQTGAKTEIRYNEQLSDDGAPTVSLISFDDDDRGTVSVVREGEIGSAFFYTAGQRYYGQMDFGFMKLDVCVSTSLLINTVTYASGGKLEIRYKTEFRGSEAQDVDLNIRID